MPGTHSHQFAAGVEALTTRTHRLTVVLDDRLRERTEGGGFSGVAQLTPGLRELLDDESFDVELWCRDWRGTGGHVTAVQKPAQVRHLPSWTRVGILWAVPSLLRRARRLRRTDSHVLSVGPSFSQLALLVAGPRLRTGRRRSKVTWLVRSDPGESLMLTREASNAAVRTAIRAFCLLWRRLIRRQDDVVCVSTAVAREIGIYRPTIAPEIGWGELDDSGAVHQQHRRRGVLFVGRLSPEKGPDIAVDAFLGLSQSRAVGERLTVVGTGDMEPALRRRALPLGDRVQFVGAQSRDAVSELMSSAAVVLVPSRSEGFGLAAFEAAARGATVLHSGVGGLNEACGWWHLSKALPLDEPDVWSRELEATLAYAPNVGTPTVSEIQSLTGWPSLRHVMHERVTD